MLPLRNPVVLAKTTASLDRMSGGRLMLGVAAGWYEREFEACGVSFKDRGKLFVRNLEVLNRFWTEDMVDGEYDGMAFRRAVMLPRPLQTPRPPLLIGGYVDRVLRRVARFADGWLTYFYTPESFTEAWAKVRRFAEEEGRDPDSLLNVAQLPFCADTSFETADRRVRSFIDSYFDHGRQRHPWNAGAMRGAARPARGRRGPAPRPRALRLCARAGGGDRGGDPSTISSR